MFEAERYSLPSVLGFPKNQQEEEGDIPNQEGKGAEETSIRIRKVAFRLVGCANEVRGSLPVLYVIKCILIPH